MIGSLKGKIIEKNPPFLLLEVAGVGYEVETSMTTYYELPETGNEVFLKTQMIVREDAQLLYGFYSQDEKSMFKELIKISGIGPKVALAILSGMQVEEFINCIDAQDIQRLTKVPGIGKKTAERLVIEIKDKIEKLGLCSSISTTTPRSNGENTGSSDATTALMTLGYKQTEAEKMVKKVYSPEMSTEDIIKSALRSTAK